MEAATLNYRRDAHARTFSGSIPGRSLEQRRDALAKANVVRSFRATVKAELSSMERRDAHARAVALIQDPPEMMDSMRVSELLQALPRFGVRKVGRFLTTAQCSHAKTLGGLSGRQRDALVEALR